MAEKPIEWGLVGTNATDTREGQAGGSGVAREVEDHVAWCEPPLDALGLPCWRAAPGEPGRFRLDWPLDAESAWSHDPAQYQTLHRLGEVLRPLRGNLKPDDPRLAELDGTARRLVEVVAALHEHGLSVGLLHPQNVLVQRGSGGRNLVLADHGFVWERPDGEAFLPAWVNTAQKAAPLWLPRTPEQQQQLTPLDGARRGEDLRVTARVLASVLLGQSVAAIPRAIGDARTGPAARPGFDTRSEIWEVLARAEAGQHETAADLLTALEESAARNGGRTLSQHLLKSVWTPPKPPTPRRWPVALVVLVLLAGGAALAYGAWRGWDFLPLPHAGASKVAALEKKYREAAPAAKFDALEPMVADPAVFSLDPRVRAEEEKAIDAARRDFVTTRWQEFERVVDDTWREGFTLARHRRVLALIDELQELQGYSPKDDSLRVEERTCLAQYRSFLPPE